MRWIAIGLNALLIVTVIYLFGTKGAPSKEDLFLAIVLFAAPVSSLVLLLFQSRESWLGLYFKRKALEEKKKIEKPGGNECGKAALVM